MEIKDPDVLRWVELAKHYPKLLRLPRPFHVVMGEAVDAGREFKADYLDQAMTVAAQLRQKPTQPSAMTAEASEWIDLRNQLTNMLMERVAQLNAAGKLVFRDRPDIARKFASAYERRRRAEARRKAKQKAAEGDQSVAYLPA